MFISKIKSAISSRISPIGELYRESKNGIKVYRHISNDGTKVKLSSFMPDGKPFKTILKENVDSVTCSSKRVIGKMKGRIVVAKNHNTGVTTNIREMTTSYYPVSANNFVVRPAKTPQTAVVKEYSYNNRKNGNTVGRLIYKEESPTKGLEIVSEFDKSGNIISSESKQFTILG